MKYCSEYDVFVPEETRCATDDDHWNCGNCGEHIWSPCWRENEIDKDYEGTGG